MAMLVPLVLALLHTVAAQASTARAEMFTSTTKRRSLSSQSDADSDGPSEQEERPTVGITFGRLLISLVATILLWSTSLRVVNENTVAVKQRQAALAVWNRCNREKPDEKKRYLDTGCLKADFVKKLTDQANHTAGVCHSHSSSHFNSPELNAFTTWGPAGCSMRSLASGHRVHW